MKPEIWVRFPTMPFRQCVRVVKEVHLRCIEPEGSRRFEPCHWHGAKHHFKLFSSSVSSGKSRFKMSVRVVCTFVSPYFFPIQLAEHGSYEPKAEVSFLLCCLYSIVDHYLHSFCFVSKGFKPLTEHFFPSLAGAMKSGSDSRTRFSALAQW